MNRRRFFSALPVAVVGLASLPTALAKDGPDPWRVRLDAPTPTSPFYASRIYDAETGADVSMYFPAQAARRLDRSWRTGQPIRLVRFVLGLDGQPRRADPSRLLVEPVQVLVVAWDGRRLGSSTSREAIPERQCPVCSKPVVWARARSAEVAPVNRCRVEEPIGRLYFHADGSFCDVPTKRLTPA